MPKIFSKKQTTFFQKRVYDIVKKIPRGKVLSYKEIAKLTGSSRAWRAVGNILNKNRDPKIPCYRVIKSDGKIGGYKNGPRKKAYVLRKEGVIIRNRRIVL
jgi:methylated-DNA-[protein]-cysteine S-methyltransferase